MCSAGSTKLNSDTDGIEDLLLKVSSSWILSSLTSLLSGLAYSKRISSDMFFWTFKVHVGYYLCFLEGLLEFAYDVTANFFPVSISTLEDVVSSYLKEGNSSLS